MKHICKKSLSFLLALCMIVSLFAGLSITASAEASQTVTVKVVDSASAERTLATWTYDSTNKTYIDGNTKTELAIVSDYSSAPLVYTGINKKPDPRCLSVTTKGIALEDFYNYAEALLGVPANTLRGDTALTLACGTFKDTFTYNQYWGLTRYYYPNWYAATYSATPEASVFDDGVEVPATLAICGYHATTGSSVETLVAGADDSNALRISLGMQANGNTSIADSWAHTGNNGGAGDKNEGNLSVKNIDTITFTLNDTFANVIPDSNAFSGSVAVKLDGIEKKTYSASDLTTLAAAHTGTLYFSGIGGGKRTINDARTLAAAKSYVTVEELLTGAIGGYTDAVYADYDIVFTASDNHTTTMTVGSLLGTTRYYYPAWLTAATYTDNITGAVAANAAAVPAVLTLCGYTATSDDNGLDSESATYGCFADPSRLDAVCDATKAPRLLLGQKSGGDSTEPNLGGLSSSNVVSIELKAPVAHNVTKAACTNGSFTVAPESAYKGATITVTTAPESGYVVESVLAGTTAATETAENTYTFTMPDADVTVTVTFAQSTATTADTTWYNTTDTSFTLSDAADLLGLASIVNGGNDLSGKTVTLANDISLSGVSFTPIGDATHPFAGTFSGAGKEISGLSVNSTASYAGLFGYNKGTIKNLTLAGTVTATGAVDFVGSVAGYNGGTITSVTSSVTVTAEDAYNVGGITGFNDGGKFVTSTGTQTETGNNASITKSAYTGSVTGNTKVGGIAGENSGTVQYCYCSGTVDGTNASKKNGVGGIVGRNGNNNTAYEEGLVDSCYFTGTVGRSGQKWVGGIAGFNNSLSTVENCYMVGTMNTSVPGTGYDNMIVGGQEGTGTNNYALAFSGNTGTTEAEIGIVKTDAEMKAAEMVGLLNGSTGAAWAANAGGYPVLFWQVKTSSYDWSSTTWAGGLDFSWYDAADVKTSYHITTPAQWEALAWICSEHLADLADYATKTNGNVTAIKGTIPTAQNTFAGVQFYLDNDIDMGGVCTEGTWSGPNYYPIGSQGANDAGTACWYGLFYGSVNGQGHTVKNVYCNRGAGSSYESVGLFGRVGEPDTASRSSNPADYPNANKNIVIENIAVTGYIKSGRSVGGIVGKTLHVFTDKTVTVRNCINFAEVSSTDKKGVGGVVGALWNVATVENCANFGTVNGANKSACTGGVVGTNDGANFVSNSYNVGDVKNSAGGAYAGAICGDNNQAEKMVNCYYLADSLKVTGSGITVYGTSKTAAEMKSAAFAVALNTDNADAWTIPADSESVYTLMNTLGFAGYPVPKAFSTAAAPVSEVSFTPTVNEGTATAAVSDIVSVTKDAPFTVSVKAADPTAVTKDEVSISAAALTTLATAEEFTLEGNVGTISMPAAALSSIVTAAGSDPLSITVETKTAQAVTGVAAADLQNAAIVEINLTAGTKSITSFGGSTITISIPAGANHEVGKTYKVIELSANSSKKILTGNCVMENGAKVLQMEVSGLSTFVGTTSQAYSVALSADTTGIVGKDVEVKLAVSNGTATKFNSYDFTLTYESTLLTYQSISLTGATVDSATTAGTLYIRGCGADLNCADAITVTFTGAAKGSAVVTLTAAKVDAADNAVNDALQATVSKAAATIGVKQPAVSTKTTEYCSGYTLVRVTFAADGTNGNVPTYDGQPMFKVKKVGSQTAYGSTATSSDYFYVVKTDEYNADKVSYAKATVETLTKTGDANGSGTVDINDAQFVFNIYNGVQTSYTMTAKQLLAADVNGDGKIDILDCAAVIANIL